MYPITFIIKLLPHTSEKTETLEQLTTNIDKRFVVISVQFIINYRWYYVIGDVVMAVVEVSVCKLFLLYLHY